MLLRRPRAVVDVVDETYVRAAPQVVREALDAPGLLEGLWPGLERQVVQDRGERPGGRVDLEVGRTARSLDRGHAAGDVAADLDETFTGICRDAAGSRLVRGRSARRSVLRFVWSH